MPSGERDYVLGTHDDEIARLGLQHRVWRASALDCWRRGGVTIGSRVLDVGAGPGYATLDLAEIVGPTGEVTGLERSARFLESASTRCKGQGLTNVRLHELDLMLDPWPAQEQDAVWCRWVASFVSSPETLVKKIAGALRPGGVAMFHEYDCYTTWRFAPRSPAQEEFVRQVMESWRATGGEPDVATSVLQHLVSHGFTIRHVAPLMFCARPGDYVWQWPAAFLEVGLARLLDLGRVDAAWADRLRREVKAAEADPRSVMLTPMVLEIIAERNAPGRAG